MSIVRHSTGSPFGESDSSRWNPEGNPPWIPIVNRRSSMKGPNNNINTSRTRDVENQLTSGKTIRFGANERSNSFNVYDPPEHIHYPRVTHDTKSEQLPKMVRSPTQSDLQDNNPFISISSVPSTVREVDTSSPTLNEYLKHISTNDKNETERRNEAFSKGEYFPSGGRRTKRTRRRKTWTASFSRKKRKGTKRKGTKRKGTKRKTRRLHR